MQYYWEYGEPYLQPAEVYIPFFIGSAGHKGLELWYKGDLTDAQILAEIELFMDSYLEGKFVPPNQQKDLKQNRAIVIGLLMAYFNYDRYKRLRDNTEIIHLEQSLQTSINFWGKTIDFIGTPDKVYRSKRSGEIFVEDYKFKADYKFAEIQALTRNLQAQLYPYLVEKVLGNLTKVSGLWYSVISKPKIRLKQTESVDEYCERIKMEYLVTPEKYFHRDLCRCNKDDRKAAMTALKTIINDIDKAETFKLWDQHEGSCVQYFGQPCKYMRLCNARTNQERDLIIEQHYAPRQELERGDVLCCGDSLKKK
jgi:hypothetical protein